ncbi:MAG TPA: hypothetical protein VGE07_14130 [Herpetosiphonaceae bacterium]
MAHDTQHQPATDDQIAAQLATLRDTVVRELMERDNDDSVIVLDLIDLALEVCEGLLQDELTGALPLLVERLLDVMQIVEDDQGEPEHIDARPVRKVLAA